MYGDSTHRLRPPQSRCAKFAIVDVALDADLAVTSGTIEIDENHQVVNVEIVLDPSSYSSRNAKRNEHVISQDFLDVEAHPSIVFQTNTVSASGEGYKASGTATVKGKTSPIDVTVTDVSFSDTTGSFTAAAVIDRKAVGIDTMPTFVIGQNLNVTINAKVERIS